MANQRHIYFILNDVFKVFHSNFRRPRLFLGLLAFIGIGILPVQAFGQNEPPIISGTGNQSFCPGREVPVAQTIAISDIDNTSTEAVYIQISDGYLSGEDLLSLTGTHPNINPIWSPVEGELTLQGPATYGEFENAILGTVFTTTSTSPGSNRQFSITVGEANFLPSTQHYYEYVEDSGITWADARVAAENRTFFGLQGYLATLTSQEEADFSGSQANGVGWIGASDDGVEGEWRWVTGPEAGTLFWNGGIGGTEITFAFWNSNEPNDFPGGPGTPGQENYAHITDPRVTSTPGTWNDLRNSGGGGLYSSRGYVVEYGGTPGDPLLNITLTTQVSLKCTIITNRNIRFNVKKN
ncbi:MAG: C-type lectin domain-containing protein [Bacteroidota bacterium]